MQTNSQATQKRNAHAKSGLAEQAARRRVSAATFCLSGLLLTMPLCAGQAQQPAASPTASPATNTSPATNVRPAGNSSRRRAAKLYLASSKLFEKGQFEEAMRGYAQAAALDAGNPDYPLAAGVARSHAVTALLQSAALDRTRGRAAEARAALAHALQMEPENPQVREHLNELGDDALLGQMRPLYEQGGKTAGEAVEMEAAAGVHSFHLHTSQRQIIQQVFKAYGIDVTVDNSVRPEPARLDVDDADFAAATRVVEMVTGSFHVPLDAHHALVARDTKENRQQFTPQQLETVYLPGLNATELTDVVNLAKNVFGAPQAVAEPTSGTISIRAPRRTLNAFNATMQELLDGHSQLMLEVRMIQLAHTSTRNTGVQTPSSMGIFNVAAEAQSIFTANQSLIQEIISSGLASANDFMAILGILVASGEVSDSPLSSGFAVFGGSLSGCSSSIFSCKGALTTFGLSPGTTTANLNLNSSNSRQLDQMQLHLGDGEAATLRLGSRYPIQTSSYSSLGGASTTSIAGLTTAGTSSSLSSLLASYSSSVSNIPQVEYQDLGLTLKATPKVMRGGGVALTIDMKLDALAGTSINGNPVLNSRSYSGVVTLKQGETVELMSEMDSSESRAVSGMPGISEIPGMNNLTDKDTQKNYATLLVVITPHVIRGQQAAGRSPMLRVERGELR